MSHFLGKYILDRSYRSLDKDFFNKFFRKTFGDCRLKLDIVISAEDLASGKFQKVDKELRKVSKESASVDRSFKTLKTSSDAIVQAFRRIAIQATAVFSTFQLSKSFIEVNAQFERFQVTLETLYKSNQKAKAVFDSLLDFASKTPFEINQLTEAWVKMKAMGLEPNLDMFQKIGDAVSALGGSQEIFDGIITALGQMQAKGKVSAEELMQLAERGVPVFEILQEKLGLTKEQLANIGNEGIEASKAINALVEGMGEKFAGNMERMSNTWSGIISNLKDSWTRFMMLIGDGGAFQSLKEGLKSIQDKIEKAFDTGKAQKWANVISKSLTLIGDMFYSVFDIVKTITVGIYNAFIGVFKGIYDFGRRIFTEEGFFESMIDAFIVAVKTLPKVFVKGLGVIAIQVVKWASELFRPIIVAVEWAVDNIVRAFKRAINSIKKAFVDLRNWIAEKLSFEKEIFGKKISFKLFDKVDYKPIFDEAETRYISFAETAKRVNKEQEEMIKKLSKLQSGLGGQIKQEWREALKQIRESGKAGQVIADGLEAYVKNIGNILSSVSEKLKEMQAKGVKGLDELQEIISKSEEQFKKRTQKTLEDIVQKTKETTSKMKSFWEDFFNSVSKNPFWKKILEFGKKAWEGIKGAFSGGAKQGETGIISRVKNSFSNIMSGATAGGLIGAAFLTDQLMQSEKIRKAMDKIFGAIQKIIEPVAEVIAPILESIAPVIESFKPIFQIIAESMKPVAWILKRIAEGIARMINFFTSVAKPVWNGIQKALEMIKNIVEAIAKALKAIKNGASDIWDNTVGKIAKGIGRALPFFHDGGVVKPIVAHQGMYIGKLRGDEVPAILQTGEYVVNRNATQKYRPVLEAINSGQDVLAGDTNITVNIYAQNFDRRFVEDELLPLLEDYHKRGKLRWE